MPARHERPWSAADDYAMTIAEAAALLTARRIAISPWTLKRRIAAGAVPAIKVGSKLWIMRGDLEAWLAKGGELHPAATEAQPEPVDAA
jgi:excisionase family DNA binding protein